MKQRKRIAAFVMAAAMVFSTLPMNALAVEPQVVSGGLCEHHTEHTADCGYTEGTVEMPCTHEHNEACYTLVTKCIHEHTADCYPAESVVDSTAVPSDAENREPTACVHTCSEESGCITKTLECLHEHDEACGFALATEGTPCTYVCEICNSQDGSAQEQCSCVTLCTEGNTNLDCSVCNAENADLTQCKGTPTQEEVKCICTVPCTEGAVNIDCPVCGAENADLTQCKGTPAQEELKCICTVPCTEGAVNIDCPVCGVENADLTQCKGKKPSEQMKAVQDQINALPTVEEVKAMTAEEQQAVYEKMQAAYAAYNALSEEQKAQITGMEKLDNLLAFFAGMANTLAANANVTYLDESGSEQTVSTFTEVTSSTTAWSAGWYVVNGNVEISERITVTGDVHLILADSCKLTASQGIHVSGENALTIYGQSAGTGSLDANATSLRAYAGIGGGSGENAGTITINGGMINAFSRYGAGIGSGYGGTGTSVFITGGVICASSEEGAGIGTGEKGSGNKNVIDISGGTITATSDYGTGIGSGNQYSESSFNITISITISRGNITAKTSSGDYGIGGEGYGKVLITGGRVKANGTLSSVGLGLNNSPDASVTITDGMVVAEEGIYGTFSTGESGNAIIVASDIRDKTNKEKWSGLIITKNAEEGKLYGSHTTFEVGGLEIPAEYTLTVEKGQELTIAAGTALINRGTIVNNGTITNNGAFQNYGTLSGSSLQGNEQATDTAQVKFTISGTSVTEDSTSVYSAAYGSEIILTATVTDPTGNPVIIGDVTFYDNRVRERNALNKGGTAVDNNGTATCSFTLEGGDWNPSTNYGSKHTIIAVYRGSGNILENQVSGTLKMTKGQYGKAPAAPTLYERDTNRIVLNSVVSDIDTARIEYGYVEGTSGTPNNWESSVYFWNLTPATAYTFYTRYSEDYYYAPSAPSAGTTIYTLPVTPQPSDVTINYAEETISFKDTLEMNTTEQFNGTDITSGSSITEYIPNDGTSAYLYVRAKELTESFPASEALAIRLFRYPTLNNVTGVNETISGKKDGKITGVFYGVQYRKDGKNYWTDCTGTTIENLAPGVYWVRIAPMNSAFASEAVSVEIKTGSARTYTLNVTAPAFDSVYTGYAQPEAKAITITSTGNSDATISSVTVDSQNFTISGSGDTVTAGESINTWMIQPAAGLAVGTHTATITVAYNDDATATAEVSFVVNQQPGGSSSGNSSGDRGDSSDKDSTIINRPEKNEPNTSTTDFPSKNNPSKNNPSTPTIGQTKPVKPGSNGNASINKSTVQNAINKATAAAKKQGNSKNGIAVVVPVELDKKLDGVQITLNEDALKKLTASKVEYITIATDRMIEYSFTLDTLKELNRRTSGDIVFKVKKSTVSSAEAKTAIGTRPTYDISLWSVKNRKETRLTSLNGKGISIAIPYTPTKNEQTGNLYAVSVDAAGKVKWITKSSYNADRKAVIFEMPQSGTYSVGYDAKTPAFTDITNHWAKDNILFAVSRGLLNGTSKTTFSPDSGMTREMFVTALGRLAGINPDSYRTGKFTDVKADADYAPYVNWAASKGIVSGTTDTTFAPDKQITREQMAVILKDYAAKLGYTIPKTLKAVTFADHAKISSQAKEAVKSMQQAGILAGKTNNRFDPKGTATRAEVATVLRRFVEIVIDPQTANGWQQNDSGEWSYCKDGEPVKGWLSNDQKKYWLDKTTGKKFSSGWKQIDGKQYYFYADGSMAVNTTVDGYQVGADGARVK